MGSFLMARPKKETTQLANDWQELVLTEMEHGASLQEVKVLLGISNDLYDRWMKEDIEFSETIKRGKELSEAWWLKQGRTNLSNKEFSPTLWYMNMKNRFGWRDRSENETRITLPTPILGGGSVRSNNSHEEDTEA
jgi:hypothetical protein